MSSDEYDVVRSDDASKAEDVALDSASQGSQSDDGQQGGIAKPFKKIRRQGPAPTAAQSSGLQCALITATAGTEAEFKEILVWGAYPSPPPRLY